MQINDEVPMVLPLKEGALMPTHSPQVGTIDNVLSLR
jgi:hypothetical protein